MPKSKQKEKRLHFAGYDFTSGPEGTVIHRPSPARPGFSPGDRVEYRDVNLTQQGTVTGADGKWIMVRWDGRSFESREWAPNLRHVTTSASHATKAQPYGTPGSLEHVRGVRAREIVRLAAEQVKDPSTRFWLLADERGTFEKAARKYLEDTADKARALGMSNAKVNEEIAVMLALSAVEAFLKRARKVR